MSGTPSSSVPRQRRRVASAPPHVRHHPLARSQSRPPQRSRWIDSGLARSGVRPRTGRRQRPYRRQRGRDIPDPGESGAEFRAMLGPRSHPLILYPEAAVAIHQASVQSAALHLQRADWVDWNFYDHQPFGLVLSTDDFQDLAAKMKAAGTGTWCPSTWLWPAGSIRRSPVQWVTTWGGVRDRALRALRR